MNTTETFGVDSELAHIDPLYQKQQDQVNQMRTYLLSCNEHDPRSVKYALQNVLVLRVYHSITRVVRYLDMMDRLEDKLYQTIENSVMTMSDADPRTWLTLLNIQERLQKIMIDNQKLLEPYLNISELSFLDVPVEPEVSDTFANKVFDQDSRERIRTSAQQVLDVLSESIDEDDKELVEENAD